MLCLVEEVGAEERRQKFQCKSSSFKKKGERSIHEHERLSYLQDLRCADGG